ncbi:MAG: hypothetical protein JSR80_01765 [Verrucomicrobia bacterium]|nr:hypothetical protein [Verrucomicrobiota bacterium]
MLQKIAFLFLLMVNAFWLPISAEWKVAPSLGIRRDNISGTGGQLKNIGSFEGRVAVEHCDPCGGLWLGGEAGGGRIVDAAECFDGGVLDLEMSCGRMFCPPDQSTVRLIPSAGLSYHGFWLKDRASTASPLKMRADMNLGALFGGFELRFIGDSIGLRALAQMQTGLVHSSTSLNLRNFPYYEMHARSLAATVGGVLKFEGSYLIGECYDFSLSSYVRDYWIGKSSGTISGENDRGPFVGSLRDANSGQWWTWGINMELSRKF